MRYRPLGARGQVISAVSLVLEPDSTRRNAGDWVSLIYAALECGVSGFEIRGADAALGEGLAHAFSGVDRRLAFIALRTAGRRGKVLSFEAVGAGVRDTLAKSGLDYLDAVLLNEPTVAEIPAVRELGALRSAGLVRALGVAGDGEGVEALVARGEVDMLATGYSLLSGWAERRRLRTAVAADMAVLGYGVYPHERLQPLTERPAKDRARPLAGVGGYGFLEQTKDWTAEELCLAYALTEPSLATVLLRIQSVDHLERLAAVPDREFPPAAAAQIEMARFSPQPERPARRTA
ncbi:MAG TPA: aldo/keto reductase, partial [Caulobacteraceae bacterium]